MNNSNVDISSAIKIQELTDPQGVNVGGLWMSKTAQLVWARRG